MKANILIILTVFSAAVVSTDFALAIAPWHTLKIKNTVQQTIAQLREHSKNRDKPMSRLEISDQDLIDADAHEVLSFLKSYEKDSNYLVKRFAFWLEMRLGVLHKQDVALRQKITQGLIDAHLDPNAGLSPHPYRYLLTFTAKDFDSQTKATILGEVGKKDPSGKIIKICGVANIPESLAILEKSLMDEKAYQDQTRRKGRTKWYYMEGWAARLALSRMGDKDSIKKCISLIKQEIETNNNFRLLTDLGYIRQPEAIESLKRYFLGDLRLPPTKPGMEGEPYSQYLMPMLEDNLSNFPVKKSETHKLGRIYRKEEIELCKEWMSRQKQWEIVR